MKSEVSDVIRDLAAVRVVADHYRRLSEKRGEALKQVKNQTNPKGCITKTLHEIALEGLKDSD